MIFRNLLLIFIFLPAISLSAQVTKTNYYDTQWMGSTQDEAEYKRIFTTNAEGKVIGKVRDYFITGELQGEMDSAVYIDKYDDSKSIFVGKSKGYYKSGKLNFENEYDLNGEMIKSIHYHENGMKKSMFGDCINEKCYKHFTEEGKLFRIDTMINSELAAILYLNEHGKHLRHLPIINGKVDSLAMIEYIYDNNKNLFGTFTGWKENVEGKTLMYGRFCYFTPQLDTISSIFIGTSLESTNWKTVKYFGNKKPTTSEFFDDFSKGQPSWYLRSNENATAKIENKSLQINLNNSGFFRAIPLIPITELGFYDNNFELSFTTGFNSNAFIEGVEIMGLDQENTNRFGFSSEAGAFVFERLEEGIRVVSEKVEFSPDIHTKSYEIKIRKVGDVIDIYKNGDYFHTIKNFKFYGNNIALVAGAATKNETAEFIRFSCKIGGVSSIVVETKPIAIPVKLTGGVFSVPIELNGVLKIDFIFDSGASDVSISPDVALTLVKTGTISEKDWLPGAYYQFADGSTSKSERFVLRSVKIGDKTVYNVTCSISNSINAPMLLGQSFLKKFGRYTFDNNRLELILD